MDENLAEVYGTWSLGRLIDTLERYPIEDNVIFDFGRLVPTGVESSRGSYDHLAINYGHGNITVEILLDNLERCGRKGILRLQRRNI